MPSSPPSGAWSDSARELDQLDRQLISLLRRRAEVSRAQAAMTLSSSPTEPESRAIELFRSEFGGPGELLARAVLNLCGIKRRPPVRLDSDRCRG
ncbi:hypothetical protein CJD44_00910 [Streptomyces sp. alain-838]|nr:hypothetical protein [Streptomyces sp. alain-838]PAK28035.1 hypothetical protein CJD44_00910 [Streptomyces sp. alain-838]